MGILTLVDLLGIQRFIFESNRLRDILAGSMLVRKASTEILSDFAQRSGQVVYSAGGTGLIRFEAMEDAREFAGRYTRWLFDKAPGLDAAILHKNYDGNGDFIGTIEDLGEQMSLLKLRRRRQLPLGGLGVTESCYETGQPAVAFDRESTNSVPVEPPLPDDSHQTRPISASVKARRAADLERQSDERWVRFLPSTEVEIRGEEVQLEFPKDLDHLGRSRTEKSLMAVVHIDMNDTGEKLRKMQETLRGEKEETARARIKSTSEQIKNIAAKAFRVCVQRVVKSIVAEKKDDGRHYYIQHAKATSKFELLYHDGTLSLPLRPIVLGGDDLTIVCDARIAFDLAAAALEEFERGNIEGVGQITGCAGIAIGRTHTPFFRLYQRSEELCRNAKRWRHAADYAGSALDWHIEYGQSIGPIEELRARYLKPISSASQEFTTYRFTCRPYPLDYDDEYLSWRWLSDTFLCGPNGLQTGSWAERRNKVYRLREAALEGEDVVKGLLERWKRLGDNLRLPAEIGNGYFKNQTPVLDAVELVSLYFKLR